MEGQQRGMGGWMSRNGGSVVSHSGHRQQPITHGPMEFSVGACIDKQGSAF